MSIEATYVTHIYTNPHQNEVLT